MAEEGLKVFEDYQKSVGSQNDKANRRLGFADDFFTFVNQHETVIKEIKADYTKPLDKVTAEETGMNFDDTKSSPLALVERQILAGITKYEEMVEQVTLLLPVNNR